MPVPRMEIRIFFWARILAEVTARKISPSFERISRKVLRRKSGK
jgi:hypothetical protein